MKSDKIPQIIYADIESLIKKIDNCKNKPEKIEKHIPCGYPKSIIWALDHIENKHSLYWGEDCTKTSCEYLREYAKNIIDFEKKKMLSLTKAVLKLDEEAAECYIFRNRILKKVWKK